jgi:RimJ/RimL family protein N-acetyltransferase
MRSVTAEAYAGMLCAAAVSAALESDMHDASFLSLHVAIAGTGVEASLTLGQTTDVSALVETLPPQVAYLIDTSVPHDRARPSAIAPDGLVIEWTDLATVCETLDEELALEYGFVHAERILQARADAQLLGFACVYRQIREMPEIGIWVAPASRGRGVGRALVSAVMAEAAASVPWVNWATLESNTISRALVPPGSAVLYEARIVTNGIPSQPQS